MATFLTAAIAHIFSIFEPAVWIALAALITSVGALIQNWRHDKLSVFPNIDIHRIDGASGYLALESTGLGPAKLIEVRATIEGKDFIISTFEGMQDFLERPELLGLIVEYHILSYGGYYQPNSTQKIFIFSEIPNSRVRDFFNSHAFSVKWESIYGEEFNKSFSPTKSITY